MKTPESMYDDTWSEFFKRAYDDLKTWWSRRRGPRKANTKDVYWKLQYAAQSAYHMHISGEKTLAKIRARDTLKELEYLADELGMELKYTTEDLDDD